MLKILDRLPTGFLDATASELEALLGGPTLIHLEGRREPVLFVSILLHGNEDTGLEAVQALLRNYAAGGGERQLPRALSLFVGNVSAARLGLRRLDGQPDYNRVWPGSEDTVSPEAVMMGQVVEQMRERGVFAAVDVHNNTGLNPHYACVNRLEDRFFHLATLFGRTVVYYLRPLGVMSMAFAPLCPAVTLECGKVGQVRGVDHARDYLDACLHLAEVPEHPVAAHDMDLFHTVAVVKVPEGVGYGFEPRPDGIELISDLDHMNFRELPAGTVFGRVGDNGPCVEATSEAGRDVTAQFFEVTDGALVTRTAVMPSMLTLDTRIISQDCLCYLMERLDHTAGGI